MHGQEAFLNAFRGVSLQAVRRGFQAVGGDDDTLAEREGFETAVSCKCRSTLHFRDNILCFSELQANPNLGYSFHSFRYCLCFPQKRYHGYQSLSPRRRWI